MLSFTAQLLAAAILAQTPTPAPRVARFAVPVSTDVETGMFPTSWTNSTVHATAVALEGKEVDRSLEVVRQAMEKYSVKLIQKNLKKVYVCQKLVFYGLSYGGTNSTDTLYLANRGKQYGFSNQYLEESFHHEFSSVLLRNYDSEFDEKSWMACNTASYRSDGTQAVRDGTANTDYSAKYHEQGFLAQYATASIEEDFNMMAEGLFGGSRKFWLAVDKYPRLQRKMKAIVGFYHRLDASFTEARFRGFQN